MVTGETATLDLSAVRCIMSTGSPLPGGAWHWVYGRPDVLPLFAALGRRMATAGAAR